MSSTGWLLGLAPRSGRDSSPIAKGARCREIGQHERMRRARLRTKLRQEERRQEEGMVGQLHDSGFSGTVSPCDFQGSIGEIGQVVRVEAVIAAKWLHCSIAGVR